MSVVQGLGFVNTRHTAVHLSSSQMELDRSSCSLVMQLCTYIGYIGDFFFGGGGGTAADIQTLLISQHPQCQDVSIGVYVFCRYICSETKRRDIMFSTPVSYLEAGYSSCPLYA